MISISLCMIVKNEERVLKRCLDSVKDIVDENIHVANICTRCNTEDFFSYRESCQKGMKDYGTMATIVELM